MMFEPEGVTWKISLALPHSTERSGHLQMEMMKPAAKQDNVSRAKVLPKLAGLRVLVIEDESLIALDLAERLELAGAEVIPPVSTEREALQFIEKDDFNVALLDANLHGRSVNDIAVALSRRNIPFIFGTGYGREGLPSSFKQVPVLRKPVSDEQLLDSIVGIAPKQTKVV